MEGNEGQRIKEVSTPQVIVWGRRQQKFGRDMVMLWREAGRRGKQFTCFLFSLKKAYWPCSKCPCTEEWPSGHWELHRESVPTHGRECWTAGLITLFTLCAISFINIATFKNILCFRDLLFLSEKIQIEDMEKEFISGKAELFNAFCEKQVFIF